jgi:hypothetical protein
VENKRTEYIIPENSGKRKMSKKCKYYNEWTWCEPPSEPGENGTLVTEYECKNAKGYFVAYCNGNKEECYLSENQVKNG